MSPSRFPNGAQAPLPFSPDGLTKCSPVAYTPSLSPPPLLAHTLYANPPRSDAPKDVDIKDCGLRVCGNYRQANDQLQKSFPTTANGTDERTRQATWSKLLLDNGSFQHVQRVRPSPRFLPRTPRQPYTPPLASLNQHAWSSVR
jgi:hypothetical protein